MHFTKVLAVLASVTTVLSASSRNTDTRQAYSIDNIKPVVWRGEINGDAYELIGTVEQVWAQLKERHPEIQLKKRDKNALSALNKRNQELPPLCIPVAGQDWNFASLAAIEDGIEYLIGLDSRINMDATSCGRISCSYNSAIYFCNDNDYAIDPASQYLATYAEGIDNYCTLSIGGRFAVTGGQEFDTDGYNIIVCSDSC